MQTDKKMLERMTNKLSRNPAYMAWYLLQYSADEKISFQDLHAKLQLDLDQFNRLAMCKAPDGRATDFIDRLKAIETFAGVNYFLIASIIRKVDSIVALKNSENNETLLAARKRNTSTDEKNGDEL